MSKRFNITTEQFKAIRDNTRWQPFLRKFEIDKVLDGFEKDHFDKALELGCGCNFRIILRLGNYLGLSSSTAFVLREAKK